MPLHDFDAVVIGAGIVGAACAARLAEDSRRVALIEPNEPGSGATAAGMGHIVAVADAPNQLALSDYGRRLWNQLGPQLPEEAAFRRPGTLWVALNDTELAIARRMAETYRRCEIRAELLDGGQIAEREPRLRRGIVGGLLVPDDAIVYALAAARWLAGRARSPMVTLIGGGVRVARIVDRGVELSDGRSVRADVVVCAAGVAAAELLPQLPIRKRKGHLVLTGPTEGFCRCEVIELGYLASAHGHNDESIAFNVQPRDGGRVLIGATRQYGVESPEIEPRIIEALMAKAEWFMPGIGGLAIERTWTGFRAATPDAHPLIGPHPAREGLFVAAGHEGLGITTALATGELIAAMVGGRPTAIPVEAFRPDRPMAWAR